MKSAAWLLHELVVLALAGAFAFSAAARGQVQKADAQVPPIQEATGTIASIDQACSSFVLSQQTAGKRTQTAFILDPEKSPWSREPDGCSFVSLGGNKMFLKLGTRLSVRYSALNRENHVNWVVVLDEKSPGRCQGQGGVSRTPGTIYHTGCDGIGVPTCVLCPNPEYPEWARKARLAGSVILNIVILPDGSVSDVQVVQSLEKSLDESATKIVRKWRFKPVAGPEGSPVPVGVPVEVSFRIL